MFKILSHPNKNMNGSAVVAAKRMASQPSPSTQVGRKTKNTDMRVLYARRIFCPNGCLQK
jgi:hypothetical protein